MEKSDIIRHDPYLLVLRSESSWRVPLPADGEFVVGSQEGADLCLKDCIANTDTIVFRMAGGDATLDCGHGRNVTVNDLPASGLRLLVSGETVTVGAVSMVFHRPARRLPHAAACGFEDIRMRLLEETERSQRSGCPLAVLVLDLGDEAVSAPETIVKEVCRLTRFIDRVAWDGQREVIVLLPDTGAAVDVPAHRIIQAMASLAPQARGGFALCPSDAWDADALLAGARHAAQSARPGRVIGLGSSAQVIHVGPLKFVAADPTMRRLLGLVKRLAVSGLPVLVVGETGTGKEVIAQALHYWSQRASGPWVTANCAAIAPTLFESELFGHIRGAFTGATDARPGLLESAEGGTVLLDEIGDCPLACQVKLLRAIETHRVSRVGAANERALDIRIIAATNRDLELEVSRNAFRQDLYYRLNIARIVVPPLRERPLDIPVLARFFLEQACTRSRRRPMVIEAEAVRRLAVHDWPGNVRELKNVMEYCAATLDDDQLRASAPLPPVPPAGNSYDFVDGVGQAWAGVQGMSVGTGRPGGWFICCLRDPGGEIAVWIAVGSLSNYDSGAIDASHPRRSAVRVSNRGHFSLHVRALSRTGFALRGGAEPGDR